MGCRRSQHNVSDEEGDVAKGGTVEPTKRKVTVTHISARPPNPKSYRSCLVC